MSGKYSGLQLRTQEKNFLADYIPCFTHSLNLAGHSAVHNISAASMFFELVENVYCFFSTPTHRWELLVIALDGLLVVKHLSDTSWAAHSDVSKAVNCGYEKSKDGFRAIYRTPGRNSPSTTRGKGYFIQVECLGKLHLTGVLVCHHGKVLPDKHKAVEHKYGSERSREALKVIE